MVLKQIQTIKMSGNMSTEIQKINVDIDAVAVKYIYLTADERVSKAKKLWEDKYSKMEYNEETGDVMDAYQGKIKAAQKEINEQRSPTTRSLAQITKAFTDLENSLDAISKEVEEKKKNYRRKVAAEQAKKQQEAATAAEATRIKALFVPYVEDELVNLKYDLNASFLKSVQDGTYQPEEKPFTLFGPAYTNVCIKVTRKIGWTGENKELADMIRDKKDQLIKDFDREVADFKANVLKNKDNPEALKNIGRALGITYQEAVEAVEEQKEVAEINAEIEVAQAVQIVQDNGPKIRQVKVCKPQDYKEALALFNYYLAVEAPPMDDVLKMISKAMTIANRMGLKGETIQGVTFIDDVK